MRTRDIEKQMAKIRRRSDFSSKYYGKLLNWTHGWTQANIWHYGIGLSDDRIFDTGKGLRVFEPKHPVKFVRGVSGIHFDPQQTVARLVHALRAFRDWHYGLLGWNCEHLARLIATDDPISYEVRKWPIVGGMNNDGRHPTARKPLNDHLRAVAPDLVRTSHNQAIQNLGSSRQTFETLRELLVETLGIYPEVVGLDSTFRGDLGADDCDMYSLADSIEKTFSVKLNWGLLASGFAKEPRTILDCLRFVEAARQGCNQRVARQRLSYMSP